MKKVVLFVLLAMLSQASCAGFLANKRSANTTKEPITASKTHHVNVNGKARIYHVFTSSNLDKTKPLPIVFSFHGFGSSAKKQESLSKMSDLAEDAGFLVIYPEGLTNKRGKQYWNTQQTKQDIDADIDFVKAILKKLKTKYPNQTQKVFATGISNGGGMAHLLAVKMAKTFIAIAPVSGAYYDFDLVAPSKPVAVLAFHGTRDIVVPYKGRRKLPDIHNWASFWAKQNKCKPQPERFNVSRHVYGERWKNCASETLLYTIKGKGHSWPGSYMPKFITTKEIDATKEILIFFKRQLN